MPVEIVVVERQKVSLAPGIVQIIVSYQIKHDQWTSPVGHLFYDASEYSEAKEKKDLAKILEQYKKLRGIK